MVFREKRTQFCLVDPKLLSGRGWRRRRAGQAQRREGVIWRQWPGLDGGRGAEPETRVLARAPIETDGTGELL